MKSAYLFGAAFVAVLATTSFASAQFVNDNPPGWAFQHRGIVEDLNGLDPWNCRERATCGRNRYYQYRGDYAYRPYRNYRRDWRYYRD